MNMILLDIQQLLSDVINCTQISSLKTKKVRDINFLFFFLRAVSSVLYILYGILKEDYVMFASAIMPLVLEFTVLVLYLLYTKNDDVVDNDV